MSVSTTKLARTRNLYSFKRSSNSAKEHPLCAVSAAKTSLAVKQDSLASAQIQFERGTISEYKMLDAKDAVAEAQDKVDSASIDLFSAYNNYCWAVERGILN